MFGQNATEYFVAFFGDIYKMKSGWNVKKYSDVQL